MQPLLKETKRTLHPMWCWSIPTHLIMYCILWASIVRNSSSSPTFRHTYTPAKTESQDVPYIQLILYSMGYNFQNDSTHLRSSLSSPPSRHRKMSQSECWRLHKSPIKLPNSIIGQYDRTDSSVSFTSNMHRDEVTHINKHTVTWDKIINHTA